MIGVRFKGFKKFEAKVQNIQTYFSTELAPEILQETYSEILPQMPHNTGALKRALQYRTYKNTGTLTQHMPKQNRQNPRPYHLWLHGRGNTSYVRSVETSEGSVGQINIGAFLSNIRTGKTHHMNIASNIIRRKIKEKAKQATQQKQ